MRTFTSFFSWRIMWRNAWLENRLPGPFYFTAYTLGGTMSLSLSWPRFFFGKHTWKVWKTKHSVGSMIPFKLDGTYKLILRFKLHSPLADTVIIPVTLHLEWSVWVEKNVLVLELPNHRSRHPWAHVFLTSATVQITSSKGKSSGSRIAAWNRCRNLLLNRPSGRYTLCSAQPNQAI